MVRTVAVVASLIRDVACATADRSTAGDDTAKAGP